MFDPIDGSEINSLAILYQRYTYSREFYLSKNNGKFKIELDKAVEISAELNDYTNTDHIAFPYVETKTKTGFVSQPLQGLLLGNCEWGIAYNGTYSGSDKEPKVGSIIMIDGALWIVTDIEKERDMSMTDFAVVTLNLNGIGVDFDI